MLFDAYTFWLLFLLWFIAQVFLLLAVYKTGHNAGYNEGWKDGVNCYGD